MMAIALSRSFSNGDGIGRYELGIRTRLLVSDSDSARPNGVSIVDDR
jgi:hypothetical protein